MTLLNECLPLACTWPQCSYSCVIMDHYIHRVCTEVCNFIAFISWFLTTLNLLYYSLYVWNSFLPHKYKKGEEKWWTTEQWILQTLQKPTKGECVVCFIVLSLDFLPFLLLILFYFLSLDLGFVFNYHTVLNISLLTLYYTYIINTRYDLKLDLK